MAQKTLLPKISDCTAPAPRPVSLSDQRIVQVIGAFVLLSLLCVCHVYLRFTIGDLEVQRQGLQQKAQKLQQQTREIECEIAYLRNSMRLREYAKYQMGMEESDPRTQKTAMISKALEGKYQMAGSAQIAHPTRNSGSLTQVLLTLVDANKAFAASESQEEQ